MGRINLVWQSSVHDACVHSKGWLRSYMKSQRSYYTMSDNEWEEIKWKQCVTYFESLPRGEVWLLDWDFSLRIMEKDRKCIYVKVIRNLLYLNKELYHLYMEESTDVKNHLNDHFLVIKHGSQDWGESNSFFCNLTSTFVWYHGDYSVSWKGDTQVRRGTTIMLEPEKFKKTMKILKLRYLW